MHTDRPKKDEIPPYAQAYVDHVPAGVDVVEALAAQSENTISLLRSFSDEQAGTLAYAPGKWTVKQTMGHISDTERIFSYRILRIARGDETPLPGFEQDDYVAAAGSNWRPVEDLLNELRVVREATLALLRGLGSDAWERRGTVSGFSVTVRGLIFIVGGHELHHYEILQERYRPLIAS